VVVLVVGGVFPRLAEAWIERDVTWREEAYAWPALVAFLLTAMLAAAATLVARAWQWRRTGGANLRRPDERAADVTTGSTGGDSGHLTGASNPIPVHALHQ